MNANFAIGLNSGINRLGTELISVSCYHICWNFWQYLFGLPGSCFTRY